MDPSEQVNSMHVKPSSGITRAVAAVTVVAALSFGGAAGVASASPNARVASSSIVVTSSRSVGAPDQVVGKCDKVGSKHFAKTRFLFHSALAFGAFHRYIFKPLKNGSFASGATGRVKAFLKGALAGVFTIHEIKQMVKFAEANKTLCKLVPNIAGLQTALSGLITKFKGKSATESDVSTVSSQFDSLKSLAGAAGANISDSGGSVPGV